MVRRNQAASLTQSHLWPVAQTTVAGDTISRSDVHVAHTDLSSHSSSTVDGGAGDEVEGCTKGQTEDLLSGVARQ